MGVPTIKTGPMTVEEYFAFTETRPDNEKWELIDGEPILNASPSRLHQRFFGILLFSSGTIQRQPTTIVGGDARALASGYPTQIYPSRTFSSCRPVP